MSPRKRKTFEESDSAEIFLGIFHLILRNVLPRQMSALTHFFWGALAQLGERYNGIVEVRGSIPLGSTIKKRASFYTIDT